MGRRVSTDDLVVERRLQGSPLRANKLFLCRDRALEHVENSLRIADDEKSAA